MYQPAKNHIIIFATHMPALNKICHKRYKRNLVSCAHLVFFGLSYNICALFDFAPLTFLG